MAEMKVLIDGYAKKTKNGWRASSTVVLIKENKTKILVDPGINRKRLLKVLKLEKLKPVDINVVVMTHYHPDHNFLCSLFDKAVYFDDELIYNKDREIEHHGFIPKTGIKIIKTPGHDLNHCSISVKTKKGIVVVAGDVFWWMSDEKQDTRTEILEKKADPFTKNEKELKKSRKRILEIADYIIPGHGKTFKVNTSGNKSEILKTASF